MAWVQSHRKALLAGNKQTTRHANGNLDVSTCATGHVRGPLNVALATSLSGYTLSTVNCAGATTKPSTDVAALVDGFASISALHPVNAP